jgi:hypothetical protein
MAFQQHLESMRAKPEHIRKRYAFLGSFGITAIIFTFWLGSFSSFGFASQNAVAIAVNKAGTPTQSLVASVGSLFNDVKELIFGAKKITYSSVEVLPGNK